jgi:hypothetical protein
MTSPFRMGGDRRTSARRGRRQKCARSASGSCRQFASPVHRGSVRVGPTLSRAFGNRDVFY